MAVDSQDWTKAETWRDYLSTLRQKRADLVGAPNFSMAGMTTDQRSAQEDLDKEIAKAEMKLKMLGDTGADLASRRGVSNEGSAY